MDLETKNYINKLTQAIIDEYKIELPISDIDALVVKMGGQIVRVDSFDSFYNKKVCKTGHNEFIIRIPKGHSQKEDIWPTLIALGHLFLHLGYRTNTKVWTRQKINAYRTFTYEAFDQALVFANALLLPEKDFVTVVKKYTNKDGYVNLTKVATYFDVSLEFVKRRIAFLNL